MFHVSKSYLAGSFALRDVSIELAKGEFVFLTGPSGAGKTSLLKLIFGAERPSEGQIVVLGRNIARLGESAVPPLRRKIGVVFQDFKLLPRRTVEENVALALQVTGTPPRETRARVFAILKQLGLQHRRYHHPLSLSGGEQQRLALCVALVTEPRLLLADELTGELDTETSLAVFDLLKRLSVETGLSVLVVTHDLAIAQRTDRVVRIVDGRIATQSRRGASELASIDERGTIQRPRDLMIESGIDGERVDVLSEGDSAKLRRTKLGFVFQSASLVGLISARENVNISMRLNGLRGRDARAKVEQALATVGMS